MDLLNFTFLLQTSVDGEVPVFVWVLYVIVVVIMIASLWVIFGKAGKPGWAAIIPIYNYIVWMDIVGRPAWWVLLMFVPFVNFVIAIIITNDISKAFGKGVGYTIGLILLPYIFYPMLAFGDAKYKGPVAG